MYRGSSASSDSTVDFAYADSDADSILDDSGSDIPVIYVVKEEKPDTLDISQDEIKTEKVEQPDSCEKSGKHGKGEFTWLHVLYPCCITVLLFEMFEIW